MTNANPFRTKSNLASLSRSLQPIKLKADTLVTHLSPFGLGKQTIVSSAQSNTFRPSF